MKNTLKFLIAGTLVASLVTAQEKSASTDSVLKELGAYGKAPVAEPVAVKSVVPAATVKEVAPVVAPVAVKAVVPVATVKEVAPVVVPVAAIEVAPAPVVTAASEPVKSSKGWKFWKKDTVEAAPVAEVAAVAATAPVAAVEAPASAKEVDAMVEKSRDLYVGGEFEQAQKGFEAVVKKDPENMIARMYLRKLLERDARKVEVSGMKAVTGKWSSDLVLRSYPISGEAAGKMNMKDASGALDVSVKFPDVDFPKGASAIYQPKLEKLFVRNTRENLAVVEEILSAMDVAKVSSDVEQVEIEAKFVEVSEGTLEQLGFEWRTAGQPLSVVDGVTVPAPQALFGAALRGGPIGQPMPFTQSQLIGAGATGVAGDWTAFRMEDTFSSTAPNMLVQKSGSAPLDILISALDQSSGADMLSAPRVVTKSGKKATIRVGTIHYYPEAYEVAASGGNIVYTKYVDWKERLLGVELDVTPQIDGDQIELGLNPKLLELQGTQNYEVAPTDSAYTWYQYRIGLAFKHDAIVAKLPIFRKREIKTQITIADGSTVGMGGLINEKVEKYEDKVPVLGSIPLIGRLFRNEGERAVKRNLLMFVTAKKVDPSGRINTARSFE
jgi:type II secretory pathway component GspD/PulD (secretin)